MISYKRSLKFLELFARRGSSNILDYLPSSQYFFSGSVRTGLLDVLENLKFADNDVILTPSYLPEGLVLPIKKKGIKYIFYKLNENYTIDLKHIENIYSTHAEKVKAIIYIHYFGLFKKELYELKKFCQKFNILLLEDCVHALFSMDDNGQPIGTLGDISFFSLPKALPVPDGAIFFINNKQLEVTLHYRFSLVFKLAVIFHILYLLLKDIEKNFYKLSRFGLSIIAKSFYGIYYFLLCNVNCNIKMTALSERILSNTKFSEFIEKKQLYYSIYENALSCTTNKKFSMLLYSNTNCPIGPGFPLKVQISSKYLSDEMRRRRIETLRFTKRWDYIPYINEFALDLKLMNTHIILPTDVNLSLTQIACVVENFLKLINNNDS